MMTSISKAVRVIDWNIIYVEGIADASQLSYISTPLPPLEERSDLTSFECDGAVLLLDCKLQGIDIENVTSGEFLSRKYIENFHRAMETKGIPFFPQLIEGATNG